MAWYYILFFTVCAFFIIKMLLTLVLGDTDIDVDFDADGDIDFDLSAVFSFKGALHFLLGFSSYLAAIARFKTNFNNFDVTDYVVAVSVGVLFMYGLFYLYKLMMKLNHGNVDNYDLHGCSCTVLVNLGGGDYDVLVETPGGLYKKTVHSINYDDNIPIGTKMVITEVDSKYLI